jgi:hypothetical protein
MLNTNSKQQRSKGRGRRLLIAILLLPVIVVITSVLFGVRAALFGAEASEIDRLVSLWGLVALALGLFCGLLYVLIPPLLSGNWPTMLISAALGVFPFAFLYPRLPQQVLYYIAYPVEQPFLGDPRRLVLVGGLDGFIFGGIVGFLVGLVDPKATPLNRQGLVRYLVVSALIVGIIIGSMIINESGSFGDFIANIFPWILVPVLKAGVKWWDKRRNEDV